MSTRSRLIATLVAIGVGAVLIVPIMLTTHRSSSTSTGPEIVQQDFVEIIPGDRGSVRRLPKVSGKDVSVIGDSLTVRAEDGGQWNRYLRGVSTNAKVGRAFAPGLSILQDTKSTLRRIVVIALGTNGEISDSQMRDALAAVGPQRKIVLVNVGTTASSVTWQNDVNQQMAATARAHPQQVVVADWHRMVQSNPALLSDDGIHPTMSAGVPAWTQLVVTTIRRAASLP